MAEARNTFTDSKMNQDIDARLMPTDVYRTATNISVSKSEGDGVGALENVLGNTKLTDFGFNESLSSCNVQVIGHYMDLTTNNIILFFTNFSDNSGDNLSTRAVIASGSECHIGIYNTFTGSANLIVSGAFLNFSTTHPVYGVNMIEDILFWTDNRNQPRKINWRTALNDPSYYYNEDHISVSKYYPLEAIHLIQEEIVGIALNIVDPTDGARFDYNATPSNRPTTGGTGTGLTINVVSTTGAPFNNPSGITISNPGYGYSNGDVVLLDGQSNLPITLTVQDVASMQDVVSPFLPDGTSVNPFYDTDWSGDKDFLKDKFVRFAYRFKFDDDEYSLISPFTQECFVPEQDGYFIGDDEDKTFQSSEVPFMVNKINNIKILIPGPLSYTTSNSISFTQLQNEFKVKEIDIIYKVSNDFTLRVLDTIPVETFNIVNNPFLSYTYKSEKPYKTLPSSELLRVYDQVPVRALAQEIAGNRIIYGNFVDKPTPPSSLNYEVGASEKGLSNDLIKKEYQNHSLKQNRSYQAGVVLCDRYGRQSTTLLSSIDDIISPAGVKKQGSTFYHPYKTGTSGATGGTGSFSYFSSTSSQGNSLLNTAGVPDTWSGDSLKITFHSTIDSTISSETGEPGLFSANNPLGWMSYKIVVKQSQVEYYNIYFPGLLNGYIDGDSKDPLAASPAEPVGHFALFGDNLSKVPRDLGLVGPVQTTFRTGRPSVKDDPSYYEFVDSSGTAFTADPYTEEGERLLKTRDRERDIDSGSQINNASVKLYPRVLNYNQEGGVPTHVIADNQSIAQQWYPQQNFDTVVTVGTGTELGLWSPSAVSPYNVAPVFYNYDTNPYIAKVELNPVSPAELILMGVTGPSPEAGKLNFDIQGTIGDLAAIAQDDYKVGSKNLSTKPVATGAKQQGLLINITCTLSGGTPPRQTEQGDEGPIANFGYEISNENGELMVGWEASDDIYPYSESMQILGGNSQATVNIITSKERYPGRMVPRLSVYETKPIESKLDIYWETSTSGKISELNTDIISGNVYLPTSLSPRSFFLPEDATLGRVITDWFGPRNSAGTDLGTGAGSLNTFQIVSVTTNESSVNIKTSFSVEQGTGANEGRFRLKLNNLFYYGSSGLTFNFTVRVGVENDPSSGSAALLTADLSFTDILSNSAPYFDPAAGQVYSITQSEDPGLILGFNGSADTSVWHDSITWEIISQKDSAGNDVNFFTLPTYGLLAGNFPNTTTNNVGWLFMDSAIPAAPNYYVEIRIQDSGGRFSEIWTAQITVTS